MSGEPEQPLEPAVEPPADSGVDCELEDPIAIASSTVASAMGRAGSASARAVGSGTQMATDATRRRAAAVIAAAQGLLASDLSDTFNGLVQAAVKGSATIYDKAMDAEYLTTHIGGRAHRLFDGGHTISGAWRAAQIASPDDTLMEEMLGALQGLLRDVSTPRGLPLANWDKETFDLVAESLQSSFGIPKSWFADLVSYDAAELLGGTVGVVSVIFNWNKAESETFAQLAASMGLSAAIGANPLLLLVSVVAIARAFDKARSSGDYVDVADGAFKGALTSGASMGAVALVGTAGGPVGLAMLTGIAAAVLTHTATKKVELEAVSQFVKEESQTVIRQITAQAFDVGDGAVDLAERARSGVGPRATAAADALGKQASRAGRAVATGASAAGSATASKSVVAGRAVTNAAQAAGRAGAAAATRSKSAIEPVARRARAFVDRSELEDLGSVMERLEAAGTAQNRKVYARHGAAEPLFGVSYAELNKVAKAIKTDHVLAQQLWASGNHDARVLALRVADPSSLDEALAYRWLDDVDNYILAEGLGGLCAQSCHARSLSDGWRDSPDEWIASTGWFVVTCTAEDSEVWSVGELRSLLRQIESEIAVRPNRVRHEMNGALIVMALRDGNLRRSVLAAVGRIGKVEVDHGQTGCKTPEVAPYVERTLAHRAKKAARSKRA